MIVRLRLERKRLERLPSFRELNNVMKKAGLMFLSLLLLQLYGLTDPVSAANKEAPQKFTLSGVITHVRDGDTIEVDGQAVRLAALDCPENSTSKGKEATAVAKKLKGKSIVCELTGATSYRRKVAYCRMNGQDFGELMIRTSECEVWRKYDVWKRYEDL